VKKTLPKSISPRINIMFGEDDTSLQDLRDRRDMATRDGDFKLALACAIEIDRIKFPKMTPRR